jgi:hypothetical protein
VAKKVISGNLQPQERSGGGHEVGRMKKIKVHVPSTSSPSNFHGNNNDRKGSQRRRTCLEGRGRCCVWVCGVYFDGVGDIITQGR